MFVNHQELTDRSLFSQFLDLLAHLDVKLPNWHNTKIALPLVKLF